MHFRILGPVEVEDDEGERLSLGGPKPRTLLAGLLLNAERVVPDTQLVAWLWGERPPATAMAQIHTYASELRRRLGETVTITRRRPGYLLRIDRGGLDLAEFDGLIRGASADPASAAGDLRTALALWRGPALGGTTEFLVEAEQARLEERRLAALEDRIEADLSWGRHTDLVAELTWLVSEHPLRERPRGQLMLALYRCGRQGDALAVYAEGRRTLAAELGIDPGPGLRRLEESILAADPELAAPHVPDGLTRPAQLPPDVSDFTGRGIQLRQLDELLTPVERTGPTPSAVVITALAGMAGVGKTALAVHVAHRLRERYPDGQLYVDLQGADPEPLEPQQVLARLLRALGVIRVPDGLAERAELYRSRLADRRMLILLDNAAGEQQVRPLLPGSPSCAVVVTSRSYLAGLEGARLLDLDVFEPDHAVELLARIAGPDRTAAEPEAAREITRLCGYLPLAVRIAGARLAARPHWRLSRLAERISDERHRLDELRLGDLEVRASVTLSYAGLEAPARRAFRLLGLLDVPNFASCTAADVLDAPTGETDDLLENLIDAQLLDVTRSQGRLRYRFHDLLRLLARERAGEEDSPEARRAALARMLAGCLTRAESADARLPSTCLGVLRGPVPRTSATEPTDPLDWFEAERPLLVAAVGQARAYGFVDEAWELAQTLTDSLDLAGDYDEWRDTHERTLATVRASGDRLGEAVLLRGLAQLGTYTAPPMRYLAMAGEARTLFAELDEPVGESDALRLCGTAHREDGRYDEALACLDQALELAHRADHRSGAAFAEEGIGDVRREQGLLPEAMRRFERCLELWRALDRSRHVALSLLKLGLVHRELGQSEGSQRRLREALSLFHTLGDRLSEADAQHSLGEIELGRGCFDDAAVRLELSVRLWRDLDVPYREAQTLRLLAEAKAGQGENTAATEVRRRAAVILDDLGLGQGAP